MFTLKGIMRFALLASIVFAALACRPVVHEPYTIEYVRDDGSTFVQGVDPVYRELLVKEWTRDNRGNDKSHVLLDANLRK